MTSKTQERNNRIAFPISLAEDASLRSFSDAKEIHIVPTGKWMHWSGSEFEITPDTVKGIIQAFRDGVRKDIPITAGHDNGMSGGELPAVGWFKGLIDRGVKGLYGVVEWTEEGKRLLRDRAFKYFSAELAFDYNDLETGIKADAVLVGGALTNKPFFKQLDLDPVAAFSDAQKKSLITSFSVPQIINQFNENIMDLKTIVAKKVEELTPEEKAFVVEHKAELSVEEAKAFETVIVPVASAPEAPKAPEAPVVPPVAPVAPAAPEAPVAPTVNASEKVTVSALEFSALKAQADSAVALKEQIDNLTLSGKVDALVLSSTNKVGIFAPAQKPAVTAFMKTLSETQRDQFRNIVTAIPKVNFSEIGDKGEVALTGAKDIAAKVKSLAEAKVAEAKKSNKKLTYSNAVSQVLAENAELSKQYSEALEEGQK